MPSSYHVKRCLKLPKKRLKMQIVFGLSLLSMSHVRYVLVCGWWLGILRSKKRRAEAADVSGDSLQSYTPQGGFFLPLEKKLSTCDSSVCKCAVIIGLWSGYISLLQVKKFANGSFRPRPRPEIERNGHHCRKLFPDDTKNQHILSHFWTQI